MEKGQTATEYLIILAVVIIISLIVVAVMGGFPKFGEDKYKVLAEKVCEEQGLVYVWHNYETNTVGCTTEELKYANSSTPYGVNWTQLEELYGGTE